LSSRRRCGFPAIVRTVCLLAGWRVPLALAAASACLAAGITWPIMRASRFVMFTRPFSILDGVETLLSDGDWPIATVIVAFSIVFPLLKIGVLAVLWVRLRRGAPAPSRLIAAVESFGKWSMLDVFVVAFVIFALKAGSLTDATTAPALYPFIAAILLTAYGGRTIARDCRSAERR
jgi:paraquat-inducible protein A